MWVANHPLSDFYLALVAVLFLKKAIMITNYIFLKNETVTTPIIAKISNKISFSSIKESSYRELQFRLLSDIAIRNWNFNFKSTQENVQCDSERIIITIQ